MTNFGFVQDFPVIQFSRPNKSHVLDILKKIILENLRLFISAFSNGSGCDCIVADTRNVRVAILI